MYTRNNSINSRTTLKRWAFVKWTWKLLCGFPHVFIYMGNDVEKLKEWEGAGWFVGDLLCE